VLLQRGVRLIHRRAEEAADLLDAVLVGDAAGGGVGEQRLHLHGDFIKAAQQRDLRRDHLGQAFERRLVCVDDRQLLPRKLDLAAPLVSHQC
jgi:hypothetical protein